MYPLISCDITFLNECFTNCGEYELKSTLYYSYCQCPGTEVSMLLPAIVRSPCSMQTRYPLVVRARARSYPYQRLVNAALASTTTHAYLYRNDDDSYSTLGPLGTEATDLRMFDPLTRRSRCSADVEAVHTNGEWNVEVLLLHHHEQASTIIGGAGLSAVELLLTNGYYASMEGGGGYYKNGCEDVLDACDKPTACPHSANIPRVCIVGWTPSMIPDSKNLAYAVTMPYSVDKCTFVCTTTGVRRSVLRIERECPIHGHRGPQLRSLVRKVPNQRYQRAPPSSEHNCSRRRRVHK